MSSDLFEGSAAMSRLGKKIWKKEEKVELAANHIDWMRARGFWTFLHGHIFNFFLSVSSDSWYFFLSHRCIDRACDRLVISVHNPATERLNRSIWLFRSIIDRRSSRSKLEKRSRNSIVNFSSTFSYDFE